MLLFKIIQLIIKNISSNLTSRLILHTFKSARISHNESHLALPSWNVLETFLSCKLSSSFQDPCWSSSPCPACAFLAVVDNIFLCYSYWETDFYSTASHSCVILLLCFLGHDLCLSQRSFHIPLVPVALQVSWLHQVFSSLVSQVTLSQIFSWLLYSCALDCCCLLQLWGKKLPRRKLSSLLISLSTPIFPRT